MGVELEAHQSPRRVANEGLGPPRSARCSPGRLGGLAIVALIAGALPHTAAKAQQSQTGLPDAETQNAAQLDMAFAIDRMCPNLDPADPRADVAELSRLCTDVIVNPTGASQEGQNGIVQSFNGEELQAAQQRIGRISDAQTGNIAARLSAIRAGTAGAGLSLAGLGFDVGDRALAMSDLEAGDHTIVPAQFDDGGILSRLGVFVTGELTFGDKEATGEVEGFDFDTQGLTIGADYRFSDRFVFGSAVGYSRFNSEFDESIDSPDGQELDSDAVQFSLFGSYYPTDQLFFDAIGSVGWHFYDSKRRVLITDADTGNLVTSTASGDFDAVHYGIAGNAGYTMRAAGANVTPIARLEYLRAEIDGFTEDNDSAAELAYDDYDADSLTASLGFEADYPISTAFGIISPNVRAEYVHDFIDDYDGAQVRYAVDPTGAAECPQLGGAACSSFEISAESRDQDYGIIGAGVAATFPAGWAAFVDWQTLVGLRHFDVHTVNLGLRKEF